MNDLFVNFYVSLLFYTPTAPIYVVPAARLRYTIYGSKYYKLHNEMLVLLSLGRKIFKFRPTYLFVRNPPPLVA